MAVGNPAKIIGYIEDKDPSLTMKHGINMTWKKKTFIITRILNPNFLPNNSDIFIRLQMPAKITLNM